MKNISFLSEDFQFLEVKFSKYMNRGVFVMDFLLIYYILDVFRTRHLPVCFYYIPQNRGFQITCEQYETIHIFMHC